METPPDGESTGTSPEGEEAAGAEVSVKRIQIINLCILAVTCVATLRISQAFALGVLAGGVLMAVNFSIIVTVIRSVFTKSQTSVLNVGGYWIKFVGILLLVGTLMLVFHVDVIGLLVGLSTILVAITAEAVLRLAGK